MNEYLHEYSGLYESLVQPRSSLGKGKVDLCVRTYLRRTWLIYFRQVQRGVGGRLWRQVPSTLPPHATFKV